MTLNERIDLLAQLGNYMQSSAEWEAVKSQASAVNPWFVPPFVDAASDNIATEFLNAGKLQNWIKNYQVQDEPINPKKVGLVMAGNIPMVGFHDFLCGFISGHQLIIKPSSKDDVLIRHLVGKMICWDERVSKVVAFAEQLKGLDAYIATGSNNSGRYFEYYFRNYPSIIRKNRTSAAIITGKETSADLEKLADDMLLYFGFGCRNVSKIYVPADYDFVPLIQSMDKYKWMEEHPKFKNNYDYNLSLHLLNYQYYMTNGIILLVERASMFSPISQLNFEFYKDEPPGSELLITHEAELQCLVGEGQVPFGRSQSPALSDYADGVDAMQFLAYL